MNRLQKKCLIAVAGTHLLAVVVLLCSGFITPTPKADNSQILEAIPSRTIDALLSSGVRGAQPPPPHVEAEQPPTPQPPPPVAQPPKPEVKPPEPVKVPEPAKTPEVTEPEVSRSVEPAPKPKPKPRKIDVSLTPVVRKTTEADNKEAEAKAAAKAEAEAKAEAKAAADAARKARDARIRAFSSAARSIKENSSTATSVDMPGDSTVAYANYASVVQSVYNRAWIVPDDVTDENAIVKVTVTISRNGRVTDAHVLDRSGDSSVNRSVQRTLDRVKFIAPFPDEATDPERTYIINFNLNAKRMLG